MWEFEEKMIEMYPDLPNQRYVNFEMKFFLRREECNDPNLPVYALMNTSCLEGKFERKPTIFGF